MAGGLCLAEDAEAWAVGWIGMARARSKCVYLAEDAKACAVGVVDKEAEAKADGAVGIDESFGRIGEGLCGLEGADGFLVKKVEATGA